MKPARLISVAVGLVFAIALGCASSVPTPSPDGGTSLAPDGGQPDSGQPDGGQPDGGQPDGGEPDGGQPFVPVTYTVTFPSFAAGAGLENTKCVVLDLGNADPVKIGAIHSLTTGSSVFHVEVYGDDDAALSSTPVDCEGLRFTPGRLLALTYVADDTVTLPPDVAFDLAAHQKIRLLLHYANTTAADEDVSVAVSFTTVESASHQAGLLMLETPDVNLPAGQSTSLEAFVPVGPLEGSAQFFEFTAYQHLFGTGVTLTSGTQSGPQTALYDPTDETGTRHVSVSPIGIASGEGFTLTCTWNNTLATTVRFGATSKDDICMVGAYYDEATSTALCVHTDAAGGIDGCCPGSGICSSLGF